MKLDCGLSPESQREYLNNWHPFFPWWPRRVGDNDCRAFEWIERRRIPYAWDYRYEYRLPLKFTKGTK